MRDKVQLVRGIDEFGYEYTFWVDKDGTEVPREKAIRLMTEQSTRLSRRYLLIRKR